jgi:type IX secretion system PorP/SprF family membrane protein
MKKLLVLLFAVGMTVGLSAQQGVQYTNFMFNKLGLNPAYAGSHEVPCLSAIHRSQWIGFEGAPTSQSVNFHTPIFGKRVGFGVNLQHDQIGPTDSYWANLSYAYRMPIKKGTLSLGLQASMRSYQVNLADARAIELNDPAVMTGDANKILPNFGVGAYYLSDLFYAGVSIPYVVKNDISFYDGLNGNSDFAREEPHVYAMAGMKVPVSKKVALKPALLVKYVADAPIDLDIHASFIFNDMIGVGGTYRLGGFDYSGGDSFDALVHVNFGKFKIGTAYDFSLSQVKEYQDGTFEVFIEYCMKKKDDKLTNPRFFF